MEEGYFAFEVYVLLSTQFSGLDFSSFSSQVNLARENASLVSSTVVIILTGGSKYVLALEDGFTQAAHKMTNHCILLFSLYVMTKFNLCNAVYRR